MIKINITITSVGVQHRNVLLSPHPGPKDLSGVQSSLCACLYVSLSGCLHHFLEVIKVQPVIARGAFSCRPWGKIL